MKLLYTKAGVHYRPDVEMMPYVVLAQYDAVKDQFEIVPFTLMAVAAALIRNYAFVVRSSFWRLLWRAQMLDVREGCEPCRADIHLPRRLRAG